MIPFRSLRLTLLPAIAVLALAGCGASSSAVKAKPTVAPALPTPLTTVKPAPTPVITGSVAAIVDGHAIPISKFRTYLGLLVQSSQGQPASSVKRLADQAMTELIYDQLITDFATAHGITVSPAEVDQQQGKDMKSAGGAAAFNQRLHQAGISLSGYRALVEPNILAQKVEQSLYPVKAKPQPFAHVEHILIALKPTGKPARTDAQAKALAETVFAQVQHGGNFAALAHKYSDDPGSAAKGGDLGKVTPGETVPPFDKAAFSLPLNHPAIVHSQYGYHIMVVLARGVGPAQVSSQDQQAQHTKFLAWLHKQEKQAKITRVAKVK